MSKIIQFFKRLLDDPTDPVRHCDVYKDEGCSHVDGYLCNMATCDILENHRNGVKKTAMLISSHHKECVSLMPPCKFDCPCYFEAKEAITRDNGNGGGNE